jgi:hypothetical protein
MLPLIFGQLFFEKNPDRFVASADIFLFVVTGGNDRYRLH